MKKSVLWPVVAVCTLLNLHGSPAVLEEIVGTLPPMASASDPRAYAVSADGEHVAYMALEESRQRLVIDGRAGPVFQRVGAHEVQRYQIMTDPAQPERPPVFRAERSPWAFTGQGDELVYVVQEEREQSVIIARDGVHEQWPSLGQLQRVSVSPRGHYVYALYREPAERGTRSRLILDGMVSPPEVEVINAPQAFAFHEPAEGVSHFAFIGRTRRMVDTRMREFFQLYLDGRPGDEFSSIATRQSPPQWVEIDGRLAVACVVRQGMETVDRVAIQFPDGSSEVSGPIVAGSVRFGAGGTSVGWLESEPPDRSQRFQPDATVPVAVVINGVEQYSFAADVNEPRQIVRLFHLSPDGRRWALGRYVQAHSGPATWHVLIDGQRGRDYGSLQQLRFSPDSSRFAYVAYNDGRPWVVDGFQEFGPYGQCSDLVFSDSGASLAWYGSHERGGSVFVNGTPVIDDDSGRWAWPVQFRPGTEAPVALIQREGRQLVRIGPDEYPIVVRGVSQPVFSPDGAHVALFGEFSSTPEMPGARFWVDGERVPMDQDVASVDGRSWSGFSPGGHLVAFGDYRVSEPTYQQGGTVLIDGHHVGLLYEQAARDARYPHFLEDGRFRFVGVREGQIIRFTLDLPSLVALGEAREAAAAREGARVLARIEDPKVLTSFTPIVIPTDDYVYGVGQGGEYGMGIVYRMRTDGSEFTVLHDFIGGGDHAQNPSSLILGTEGMLYGTTGPNSFFMRQPKVAGGLFRIGTDGAGYEVVATYPYSNTFRTGPILDAVGEDGALLGRSPVPHRDRGGSDAVVRIDPTSGEMKVVYRASVPVEGALPRAHPFGPYLDGGDGFFYGVANRTLFRFGDSGPAPEVLHEFRGFPLDGDTVRDLPVVFGDWLYGLTQAGGKERVGVLYRVRRDGSDYAVLRHFSRESKLMGLAAGASGVWGHRLEWTTRSGRRSQVPVLERLDIEGTEPRLVTSGGLAGTTWLGTLEGEPVLFGLRGNTYLAINLTLESAPSLDRQTIELSALVEARREAVELVPFE